MGRFQLAPIENKLVGEFFDMMSDSWPPMDVLCSTGLVSKSKRP